MTEQETTATITPAVAPGPPPVRRGAVVFAVLFVVAMITVGTVNTLSDLVESTVEQSTTIVPQGRALSVEALTGDIEIGPSPDGNVHVRTTVEYGLTRPELTEQANADEVFLASRCDGVVVAECQVDYDVLVPPDFPVYAETRSGHVRLSGLTGPLTVRTTTGDVTLSGVAGTIDVRAQSGGIRGSELRSPSVTTRTASGNVDLDLLSPPQLIDAVVTGGDIDLRVPGASRYRVTAEAPDGDQTVSVPTDPGSANTITARTSAGRVRVAPR
ncbi:DUF4097 family beta strand repeat-containing protein [Pseudonocardia sp. TRM90224]|uniref:DUF4097 family beta strand repeat-containing protein n=1 Tax=Pseudonocardia sp. TRM90224 TaxID=2812678 RepID=UPI001E455B53|nr:DUF4097 family beta strand repeat-containing protein [Pseudonocardia sp. TRM90224]